MFGVHDLCNSTNVCHRREVRVAQAHRTDASNLFSDENIGLLLLVHVQCKCNQRGDTYLYRLLLRVGVVVGQLDQLSARLRIVSMKKPYRKIGIALVGVVLLLLVSRLLVIT